MNLLHICSYYIGNQLYKNLIRKLSEKKLTQHVFIPIKNEKYNGKNQLAFEYNTVYYYYKNIVKRHDKLFYNNKIKKQMKEIETLILIGSIDFIHAHTVFSDGGTAYKINEKYGTKYIITVRNTDINTFYKYGIHLRAFMYKIFLNASAIIFISHAYKEQMLSLLPSAILTEIKDKCLVIPNGIDQFWHENNIVKKRTNSKKEISIIFIGLIDKNKNLNTVIYTCARLRLRGFNTSLHVLGNGPLEKKCKILCEELEISKYVFFHGYLSDKKSISEVMINCDIFVMPSFKETFGLVYIEAMSMGIPVIYSKGQGIDGFFDEGEVGYSVDPQNIESIIKAICKIMKNYNSISQKCVENSEQFNWDSISEYYEKIYTKQDVPFLEFKNK